MVSTFSFDADFDEETRHSWGFLVLPFSVPRAQPISRELEASLFLWPGVYVRYCVDLCMRVFCLLSCLLCVGLLVFFYLYALLYFCFCPFLYFLFFPFVFALLFVFPAIFALFSFLLLFTVIFPLFAVYVWLSVRMSAFLSVCLAVFLLSFAFRVVPD